MMEVLDPKLHSFVNQGVACHYVSTKEGDSFYLASQFFRLFLSFVCLFVSFFLSFFLSFFNKLKWSPTVDSHRPQTMVSLGGLVLYRKLILAGLNLT